MAAAAAMHWNYSGLGGNMTSFTMTGNELYGERRIQTIVKLLFTNLIGMNK